LQIDVAFDIILMWEGGVVTKRDKRLVKMQRNPKNVRPDDLDVALAAVGFSVRQQGRVTVFTHTAPIS
jgi:hypothetical protein